LKKVKNKMGGGTLVCKRGYLDAEGEEIKPEKTQEDFCEVSG